MGDRSVGGYRRVSRRRPVAAARSAPTLTPPRRQAIGRMDAPRPQSPFNDMAPHQLSYSSRQPAAPGEARRRRGVLQMSNRIYRDALFLRHPARRRDPARRIRQRRVPRGARTSSRRVPASSLRGPGGKSTTTMTESFARFLSRFPEDASTESLDALRAAEYGRLDEGGHVYLDYTGAQSLRRVAGARARRAGSPSRCLRQPALGQPARRRRPPTLVERDAAGRPRVVQRRRATTPSSSRRTRRARSSSSASRIRSRRAAGCC